MRLWIAIIVVILALVGAVIFWAVTRGRDDKKNGPNVPLAKEPEVPDGPAWFRDMTAGTGIDFTYRNGEEADLYTILESVGGGVAMIDFDNDGLLDLFFTGGGTLSAQGERGVSIQGAPCKLYKNLGNWKFKNVTAEMGLDKIDFYTHGVAVADYDRDGWPDLVATGFGRVALFRNDAGKRFIDVTDKAGIKDAAWATSAGFADLFNTGYPDLYVCHYCDWSPKNDPVCKGKGAAASEREVCPPQRFKPVVHALFRNNGDGTFRDVTKEEKLKDDGCGLGVVLADFTGEGRPGIYVANDASKNHLYLNKNGKLEEIGRRAGVDVDEHGLPNGSMGVDVADYDGSSRASLFVTNFQGEVHALYQNLGRERFSYQSQPAGLASLSRHFVGFGTSFIDIDNDGWEDLVIVNGHVLRKPQGSTLKQVPLALKNIFLPSPLRERGDGGEAAGRRFFQDWSKRGGSFFQKPAVSRGIAIGDLDNDGWPDVVISNTNSPAVLLKNEGPADSKNRWLGIRLIGKTNREIAGSTVTLQTDTRTLTRFSKGGGSYLSASDRRILFGLGEAGQVRRLTVKWAWGAEQHFDNLETGSYWELREGEEKATRLK